MRHNPFSLYQVCWDFSCVCMCVHCFVLPWQCFSEAKTSRGCVELTGEQERASIISRNAHSNDFHVSFQTEAVLLDTIKLGLASTAGCWMCRNSGPASSRSSLSSTHPHSPPQQPTRTFCPIFFCSLHNHFPDVTADQQQGFCPCN